MKLTDSDATGMDGSNSIPLVLWILIGNASRLCSLQLALDELLKHLELLSVLR
jgi:hypothetical protein